MKPDERNVLAQLTLGPKQGFELCRYRWWPGSTYVTLARLEGAHLVTREKLVDYHGTPRHWYTITDLGRTALEADPPPPPTATVVRAPWLRWLIHWSFLVLAACNSQHSGVPPDAATLPPIDAATLPVDAAALPPIDATTLPPIDAAALPPVDAAPVDAPRPPTDGAPPPPTDAGSATCTSTVTLTLTGGTATASWTCTGVGLANWHLRVVSRDGTLDDQFVEKPCPRGDANSTFHYTATFPPFVALNQLEVDGGPTIPCTAP